MRHFFCSFSSKAVLFIVAMLLLGCGSSPPARYYVLTTLTSPEEAKPALEPRVSLTVGPVTVPEYANRPQIVTRGAQNELVLGNFDRWGEPLSEVLPRIISENLSNLLRTNRVYIFPTKTPRPTDYRVEIDVTRIDGVLGREAIFQAWWAIFARDGKELVAQRSKFVEPVQSSQYTDIVQAHSRMITRLSQEIAKTIESFAGQKQP